MGNKFGKADASNEEKERVERRNLPLEIERKGEVYPTEGGGRRVGERRASTGKKEGSGRKKEGRPLDEGKGKRAYISKRIPKGCRFCREEGEKIRTGEKDVPEEGELALESSILSRRKCLQSKDGQQNLLYLKEGQKDVGMTGGRGIAYYKEKPDFGERRKASGPLPY